MVRFVRFWAIRLLGREFMAQSMAAKLVGTWFILSIILLAGFMNEQASSTEMLFSAINFIAVSGVIIRNQNTNKI